MRVKVGQRNCTVKRTTVVSRRHRLIMRVKVGQRNCMVKRTAVVSRRHRLTMRVKVGQKNCMVKRTAVVSNQHRLTTGVNFGLRAVWFRDLQLCQIGIVSPKDESWPKILYGKEDYSSVMRVLSPYKDESGLMKLYGQENYGCVRRTPSHQKGESWPKGPVSSRRLQLCQEDTVSPKGW